MRLELTRTIVHYPLKVARLPIPPPGHCCERKTGLEPATPTLARSCSTNWAIFAYFKRTSSEKRDSNPRPRPWQGRALPTELFSHQHLSHEAYPSFAVTKVATFPDTAKFFTNKITKTTPKSSTPPKTPPQSLPTHPNMDIKSFLGRDVKLRKHWKTIKIVNEVKI